MNVKFKALMNVLKAPSNVLIGKGLFLLGVVFASALAWAPVFDGLAAAMSSSIAGPSLIQKLLTAIIMLFFGILAIKLVLNMKGGAKGNGPVVQDENEQGS